jgi:hypothetical protein
MAELTSIFAGAGTEPVRRASLRVADHAVSAEPARAHVVERSPALLRKVNEFMRDGRRGQTEPERIPFFCECPRADCYEPVWLTGEMYDERRAETHAPLILPGHEQTNGGRRLRQNGRS